MSGVNVNDMVCLAVLASEDQSVGQGGSVRVVEEAKNFFPPENAAVRIVRINPPSGQATYEVYYEKAVAEAGHISLTNIRALPGATWPGDFSLTTSDYVVLSPYNFRVFGTGISGDATVEIGKNWPFWAIAIPSDYTIYTGDLVSDEGGSIVQAAGGDVVRKFAEEGSKRIELGKGSTGSEGFGTVWYGGNKPIGGDANFCQL